MKLLHLNRADEDELLRAVVPRTHLADDSLFDFGTPDAIEDRRRVRRERIYRHCWRVGIVAVALIGGIVIGFNVRLGATETKRRAEVVHEQGWTRIAMLVPQGKRRCRMDWHERCLVCEHKALGGASVKSTHC